jgi:uncharacterized membrane protein YgcG
MFSAQAVQQATQRIAAVRKSTGEELLVVTVRSVPGASVPSAISQEAQRILLQQGAAAVIYVDRGDHLDTIVARPEAWFAPRTVSAMREAMERKFRAHAYDAGLNGAVAAILGILRAHAPARGGVTNAAPRFGLYGWLVAAVLAYVVVRGMLREGACDSADNS